jgi:beta-lactamase class A
VASKTGTLDAVRAEAAVVEVPGRPFALSVMTTYLANDEDGERAIHDIAAAAFSYFDRLAKSGAYGRRP